MKKIELLAPAGSLDALKVAIQSGADAVYISGKSFGARAFATNFTNDEIKKAVQYAHILNKKVYVTINTIIYEEEFKQLEEYVQFLYDSYVDSLIVQDLGVLYFIKTRFPDFIVHASTQMSIYNKQGIINLKKLGVSRVILARETSIEQLSKLSCLGLETEVFIHGAMCYSYSGNCFLSYANGKRSGNRGECAQPCRKTYSLFENNKLILSKKNLLSMKDLMTINDLDKIIESKVTSLKIEGRMKSLEYVKNVVSLYRKKIDEYYLNNFCSITKQEQKKLEVVFNRKFTKGYLLNDDNANLVNIDSVNHLGINLGKVISKKNNRIDIILNDCLNYNDGIRFKGNNESGTFVNEIYANNILVKKAFKNQIVSIKSNAPCKVGDIVYKTVDAKEKNEALDLILNSIIKKDISLELSIKLNNKMSLCINDQNIKITEYLEHNNEIAINPFDKKRLIEQISKLNTPLLNIVNVNIDYDQKTFFKVSELNKLRRNAVETFINKLTSNVERVYLPLLNIKKSSFYSVQQFINIEAVVFNEHHKKLCNDYGIENVYYNKSYVERFDSSLNDFGMIHNIGHIKDNCSGYVGSIYLNIVNNYALDLLQLLNINKSYLSMETYIDSLHNINFNNYNVGYFVYGRSDLMVSKQCFIASSKGYINKKCNSCLKNKYAIIDENDKVYPVMTDLKNCNVRILNSSIRDDINFIPKLKELGVKNFLLIFTTETEEEINKVLNRIKNII